jgi:hypothetical protein
MIKPSEGRDSIASEAAMITTQKPRLISPSTLAEIESALKDYCSDVLSTDLTPYTQNLYIDNATNFVRWLRGEFQPGARKNPYQDRSITVKPPTRMSRR